MKKVFKYTLPIDDEVRISMPAFAEVLSVGYQGNSNGEGFPTLSLWALTDPFIPSLPRTFRIVGTGHPIEEPEKWKFIGTVFLYGGTLVFHVFELDPKRELPN
jgi:hypothetical protein